MGEADGSAAAADVVESAVAEPDTSLDEFEPLTVAFIELSELTEKNTNYIPK